MTRCIPRVARRLLWVLVPWVTYGCSSECLCDAAPTAPSDDPADYTVNTETTYALSLGEPQWVVPSDALPSEVSPQAANNNVDIVFHEDRLFMGWRTAPNHFASPDAKMLLVSSKDRGKTWDFEAEIALDSDVREPRFLSYKGTLQFLFFQGGVNPTRFQPKAMWRMKRQGLGQWTDLEKLSDGSEVPWDIKVRGGVAYMTSYKGDHYVEGAVLQLMFKHSTDGNQWHFVDDKPHVYEGGVSEAAFEFDSEGSLWAVTRNEDGDSTGAGAHVCYAAPESLGTWDCSDKSDPERYDSPEMFRHGNTIYMAARRDVDGPFGPEGDLAKYSLRPKRSALYTIDKAAKRVVHLQDIPGVGDTSFPSVQRTGTHTFLLANYTSPLEQPDISWLDGQISDKGTALYLMTLSFE